MTTKTQQIIDLLTKKPNLTVDEIAAALDFNKSKTAGLMSTMKGRCVGEKVEGSNAKRWRVADGSAAPSKTGRKPKKARKPRKARDAAIVVPPAPDTFRVGIMSDKALLVVNHETGDVREYSPDQTGAIADLLLQHFEA